MQKRLERAEKRCCSGTTWRARSANFGTSCARAPGEAVAHNLLGLVHLERREHARAMTAFSTAIRLKTPFPEALINLAVACNRTGEHELALRACELALEAVARQPAGTP